MSQNETAEAIADVLSSIRDPELHASITELGMVRRVSVDDRKATIQIALTTLGCPMRAQIQHEIEAKVLDTELVHEVSVDYVEMNADEKARAMERARFNARENAPETEIPGTARVLAVASGKGGVGKSSVTVNLATAIALQGFTVGVLDADIWGFSVPRMLGVEERLEAQEQKIVPAELAVGTGLLKVVSMGLLVEREESALMWRGLILAKALEEFLQKVRWGAMDYLLIDMPPGTGDIQMALARLLPQAAMVVVTTPSVAAQKVASRVADMAKRSHVPIVGVIENMSEFVAPDGSTHAIFGSGGGKTLADTLGSPLLATIPITGDIAEGSDTGTPLVSSDPAHPASKVIVGLAEKIVKVLLPPIEMESCTARILDAMKESYP